MPVGLARRGRPDDLCRWQQANHAIAIGPWFRTIAAAITITGANVDETVRPLNDLAQPAVGPFDQHVGTRHLNFRTGPELHAYQSFTAQRADEQIAREVWIAIASYEGRAGRSLATDHDRP